MHARHGKRIREAQTGQKILRAIVAGERDGRVLAAMKNVRIRASVDEIAKSLQGNWRAAHLFALKLKHFTCWPGLCPGTKITGGKVDERQDQALCEPGGPGLAAGRWRAAQ